MSAPALPAAVVERLRAAGESGTVITEEPIDRGTGAATDALARLTVHVRSAEGEPRNACLIRKRLSPLRSGRHGAGASDPRHWAYWRREADAYASGFLPAGPGLGAPRCFGVVGDDLYLEEVVGSVPPLPRAAEALARWQVPYDEALDRPWLSVDQLGRRLAVSSLDWGSVQADPRMVELWNSAGRLYERLAEVPRVLSHGDYSLGNLVDTGRDTVALDWATVGWEPVGFDLAHLALSCGEDPTAAYLEEPPVSELDPELVVLGFTTTVAVVGASRVHWMLSRGIEVPEWYVDFVWAHRPTP